MAQVQDATGNPILANVEASGAFAALNDEALVTLFGQAVAAVQIAGLAGAITISFEESVDGVNYQSISGVRRADGLVATSTTANGVWSFTIGGAKKFRARASAVAGGTATVSVVAGQGTGEPAFGGAVTFSPSGTQDVNLTKVAGTAVTVGSGVLGAGTQRVVLATDQPAVPISAASLPLPTGAATSALQTQPGVDIGDVTVNNAAGAAAVNVQDGGNSLTVDSTQLPAALAAGGGLKVEGVAGGVAQPISAASLPLPTGAATLAGQTQPGVDIGDVTINNAAGAAAVNIQDGGNSITVDGSVSITGTPTVDTELPAAAALADATANPTTPLAGAANEVFNGTTWDRMRGTTAGVQVQGAAASGAAKAGSPVQVGGVFNTTQPTVTTGQGVEVQSTARGAQIVATGVDAFTVDTELPAAAALADAVANPTAPAIGAFNMVWNGATWDRLTGSAGNGVETQGSVANGVADAGNPVGQGLQARTTNPTAVTDGQRVTQKSDKLGRAVVAVGQVRDLITQNTITLTTTTETTLIAAVAAVFNDLCSLILTNTSATGVRVDIRDATAGTVRFSVFLAANGGGAVINPTRPYKQTTVNNNWTAQLSAAVTDVRIFAQVEQNL